MPKTQDQTKQDGNLSIPRVGKRKEGYDPAQVDEFLERSHQLYDSPEPRLTQEEIQNTSFSIVKNGYSVAEVDAALTRLEGAVVDKRTQWDVQHYGRVAWRARTDTLARSLHDRAARPHGERFSDGRPNKPSYDRKQVDHMIDCVIAQIAGKLGKTSGIAVEGAAEPKKWRKDPEEWTLSDVADIMFTRHTGHHGYDERQVDAYINRMLQVLARIESFERIEGPISSTDSARSFEDGYADGVLDGMARSQSAASSAATDAAAGAASIADVQQAFSALVAATDQAAASQNATDGPVSQEFNTSSIAPVHTDGYQPASGQNHGYVAYDPASVPASFAPSHGGNSAAAPVAAEDAPTVASPDLARRINELTHDNASDTQSVVDAGAGMPQAFVPKGYVPRGGNRAGAVSSTGTAPSVANAPQAFTPQSATARQDSASPASAEQATASAPISFADAKHASERGNSSLASLVSDTLSSDTIQPHSAGISVPTGVAAGAPSVAPLIPQNAQQPQPQAVSDDTPVSGIIPAAAPAAHAAPNAPASTASAMFDADGFPLAETGDLTGPIPPLNGNRSGANGSQA